MSKIEHLGFTKGTPVTSGKTCRITIPALSKQNLYELLMMEKPDGEKNIIVVPHQFAAKNYVNDVLGIKTDSKKTMKIKQMESSDELEDGVGKK